MKKIGLLIFVIILFSPLQSWAADLFIMPQNLDVYTGQSFVVEIFIDSKEKINAIETEIIWPTDKLILENINNGGSVFDLWVTKPIIEQTGKIKIIAGATKGFVGKNNKVADIFFRTKDRSGNFDIVLDEQTKILKADGQGTEVKVNLMPANYGLVEGFWYMPIITSKNQPDENKWYSNKIFDVHWQKNSEYSYSYLLSRDQSVIPDEDPEEVLYDIKYENLDDGLYYFHLRARDKNDNWLSKVTRRAMIDSTRPEHFEVAITGHDKYFGLGNSLIFTAYDKNSGIDNFQIKYSDKSWEIITSPYKINKKQCKQEVIIRVFDKAGNFLDKSIELPGAFNWQLVLLIVFVFILIIILILYLIFRRRHARS